MINKPKQTAIVESIIYNNILKLSRNKLFYTKINLADTFQNRILLIFIHISFLFVKIKQSEDNEKYKIFYQKLFDFVFKQIDLNMREVGYGDVMVNKNMKALIKSFYNILFYCETYFKKNKESKIAFFNNYLERNSNEKSLNNDELEQYFNKFQTFCFDLKSDSVLKGEIIFKYN